MKITIVLGAFLPVPPTMGRAIEKVWCALSAVFAQEGHEVLVISRAIAAQVPALEQRVCVIPNPGPEPVDGPPPPPPLHEREKALLFVDRIHPEKGAHLLLEALALIPARSVPDWKLIVVGPTEPRFGGGGPHYAAQLRELARSAVIPVEFHGPIFEASALERELRAARIFLYPSLAEKGETFGSRHSRL